MYPIWSSLQPRIVLLPLLIATKWAAEGGGHGCLPPSTRAWLLWRGLFICGAAQHCWKFVCTNSLPHHLLSSASRWISLREGCFRAAAGCPRYFGMAGEVCWRMGLNPFVSWPVSLQNKLDFLQILTGSAALEEALVSRRS